jgi:tRNA (cmo5U34)-methyltransferase
MRMKSTVDQIRARFDQEVERFSSLQTGQSATMDAPLAMDLVCAAAAGVTPGAKRILDIGCGAGNYSLKMLEKLSGVEVTLVDLSEPMLQRARERVSAAGAGKIQIVQGDVREIELGVESFDIVLAAAVLHHLREESEWLAVFSKIHRALPSGGSFWIFDMVQQELPAVQGEMMRRYGEYLAKLKDEKYRDSVFEYIEREDTPRSLGFQMDLLRGVGFGAVEVLHKNALFAAFGAVK